VRAVTPLPHHGAAAARPFLRALFFATGPPLPARWGRRAGSPRARLGGALLGRVWACFWGRASPQAAGSGAPGACCARARVSGPRRRLGGRACRRLGRGAGWGLPLRCSRHWAASGRAV